MLVDVTEEVQKEVERCRRAVEAAVAEIVEFVTPGGDRRRLVEVERGLVSRLLALGRLLVALWLANRRPQRPEGRIQGPDGRFYRRDRARPTSVKVSFGTVRYKRDLYVVNRGGRGDTYAPMDREIGVQTTRFSLLCISVATWLAAKMPYAEVGSTLRQFWGWAPATKSIMKMVNQVGPLVRPFIDACPPPEDDGEVIVILVDAGGAPMITETEMARRRKPHKKHPRGESTARLRVRKPRHRKRRHKGDKSKNAKMATVGVIYTVRRVPAGVVGPIHKRVYGTFRSTEHLFMWLCGEAIKRGYGTKRTLFLADGDHKLWHLQERYFPKAEVCADWYHVVEKFWSMGTTIHEEGSSELATWVRKQTDDLHAGRVEEIILRLDEIAATLRGPGAAGKRARLEAGIKYLANNAHRMPYAKLWNEGLDIATSVVESAIRQLVRQRLDASGMRWSPARAEHVLHLRCIVLNDQWEEFERYMFEQAHAVGLREQQPPDLGRAHDAKRKEAA